MSQNPHPESQFGQPNTGYSEQGHAQGAYPPPEYAQHGYASAGGPQFGYPQADYNQPNYNQPNYSQSGYPGYSQPSYHQAPYQSGTQVPPGYYPPPARSQSRGVSIAALVLGIISFFMGFTVLIPIAAAVCGFIGLKNEPAGRGMSITGIVLGLVNLLFVVLGWLLYLGVFAAILGAGFAV